MISRKFFTIGLTTLSLTAWAQGLPNWQVAEGMESVQWHLAGDPRGVPVVELGQTNSLELNFDDFFLTTQALNYTWIHCDRNWNHSRLSSSEYLDGFLQGQLPEGRLSFNTYQDYSHIRAVLPQAECQPMLSGNYYLVILDPQLGDTLAKLPTVFVEQMASIQGRVNIPLTRALRASHQEVDVTLDISVFALNDPMQDVAISIIQNRNWNTWRSLSPRFNSGTMLSFDFDQGENAFAGGNRFRFIDSKNLPTPSLRLRRYELNDHWTAFTENEAMRGGLSYVHEPDGRGVFNPRKQNSTDSDVEADYVLVDLFLKAPSALDHPLHILGDFNAYQFRPDHALVYDSVAQGYRGQVLIKQGYCEYLFAEAIPTEGESSAWPESAIARTEGNHWDCDNWYTVVAYVSTWGDRYDRAVGMLQLRR